MPNLENFLDMVAEKIDSENDEAWYSSVNMTYAYGQVPLHLLQRSIVIFKSFAESQPEHIVL